MNGQLPFTSDDLLGPELFGQLFKLLPELSNEQEQKLYLAYWLACYGHREQVRDNGEPYFNHIVATTFILINEFGVRDVDLIIATLLHDMLEDSNLLSFRGLTTIFGPDVADLVKSVSKPKRKDKRFASDWHRHQFFFHQIQKSSVRAKILKLADRLHNLRTLLFCNPEKQRRKLQETVDVYLPLVQDIRRRDRSLAELIDSKLKGEIRRLWPLVDKPGKDHG